MSQKKEVPSNYTCFTCKMIGDHWIMRCPQSKRNKGDNKPSIKTEIFDSSSISIEVDNEHKINDDIGVEIDHEPNMFETDIRDTYQTNTIESDLSAIANDFTPTVATNNPFFFINTEFENELDMLFNNLLQSSDYIKSQNELYNYVRNCIIKFNNKWKPLNKWKTFKFGGDIWQINTCYSDIDMAIDINITNPFKKTKKYILKNVSQ
eukprot:381135_1